MVDKKQVNESILQPLTAAATKIAARNLKPDQIASLLQTQLATVSAAESGTECNGVVARILAGDTALLLNGLNEALIFKTQECSYRMISNPETEVTIRGPRESFVEILGTNIALLRRRINHPDLKVEAYQVGVKTRTKLSIVYLKGVVNEKVVAEIRLRLQRIETDGILGAGYIEQLIGDAPFSIFATTAYSERPDVVASKILEGRAAIIIDGSPEVITVPALLIESFQNPDDYNMNPYYATLIRWIRYIAFGISILGPAVYIALSSYNQELIPTPLFINMAVGAAGTPFPVLIEVIIIGLLFEIFREAGVRLPRPFGQGITFVVALVLVQASVTMGLTGVTTVVVVAITAIASFVIPSQANGSVLMRLLLAILASIFGAYGILLGLLWVLAQIVSLRSFGTPFLAPIAPLNLRDLKQDGIFRVPLWAMFYRPRTIGWLNLQRQAKKSPPYPAPPDADDSN